MKRTLSVLVLSLLAFWPCPSIGQDAAKPDPWASLHFLIGTWEAKTTGGSARAQGAGNYSFQLKLAGHLLARHSGGGSCKGPEDYNCNHADLLYLYPEGPAGALRAIYFDNEGHVIHYVVEVNPSGKVVRFVSRVQAGEPRYRLTYREADKDLVTGQFELAPPGKPEAFDRYMEWSARRKK